MNTHAESENIPLTAFKQSIATPYTQARRELQHTVKDSLNKALINPGHSWQRHFHRFTGILTFALPMLAMLWITWRVVAGFTQGGSDPAAYLGSSFAINAVLLLGLSWLLPSFLHYKSYPSIKKAVVQGINQGITIVHRDVETRVGEALSALQDDAQQLTARYQSLWQELAEPATHALPSDIKRMLALEVSSLPQRSLDVRANTQSSTDNAPLS